MNTKILTLFCLTLLAMRCGEDDDREPNYKFDKATDADFSGKVLPCLRRVQQQAMGHRSEAYGTHYGMNRNDVWYSKDGITLVQAALTATFPVRYLHPSEVFNNKLWVIGGADNTNDKNDA